MEIIELGGLSVFVDTSAVTPGRVWSSMMQPGMWFGTLLEGKVSIRQSAVGAGQWTRGTTGLFWNEQVSESEHTALTGGAVSGVFLHLPQQHAEPILSGDGLDALRRAVGGTTVAQTPIIQSIAWQILGCPLTGPSRRLYIAGKAMEMLAHLIGEKGGRSLPGEPPEATTRVWSARDVERFHAARSILLDELRDPPTVTDLARRVGTNARALGAGFVDLFGLPTYAFVKARRLDEARLMLEGGETSIARVAHHFGYQPNHFSTEFRKRFGVTPSELLGKQRTVDH